MDFATLTAASALPLLLGWYGDDVACQNTYSSANRSYSLLMNCESLSVWQTTGTPNCAKWAFDFSITVVANMSSSLSTSIESEK